MADVLKNSSDWLEEQRKKHRTIPVTYHRGQEFVALSATVGKTVFRLERESGLVEHCEARDFLVMTDDLVLAGEKVLPKRGDMIRETENGVMHVYEVLAPEGELHFRYSDAFRKTLRVHTKEIDVEVTP